MWRNDCILVVQILKAFHDLPRESLIVSKVLVLVMVLAVSSCVQIGPLVAQVFITRLIVLHVTLDICSASMLAVIPISFYSLPLVRNHNMMCLVHEGGIDVLLCW